MAGRAIKSDDDPLRDIVDLNKDDRWQARLAEARARREIALREKAGANVPPKRKPKPWEEDAGEDPDDFVIEPLIPVKEEVENKVDFADRVEVMREVVSRDPAKGRDAQPPDRPTSQPVSFDEIIPPAAGRTDRNQRKKQPARKKEDSLIAADAPEVAALATRYAATLKPEPVVEAAPEPEHERGTEEPAVTEAEDVIVRRRPRGLALLLVALAILPFTTLAPPLEKGPQVPSVRGFGLVPALGMTSAMLWRPAETVSDEWQPPNLLSPNRLLSVTPSFPVGVLRRVDGFPATPDVGAETAQVSVGGVASAPPAAQPAPLASPQGLDVSPVRMPGFASPVPRSRPPEIGQAAGVAPGDDTRYQTGPASDTAVSPTPAPAAPVAPLRVTILVPLDADRAIAEAFADDVRTRGHSVSRVLDVNLSISARNLRYFHVSDRQEASRLAKAYAASLKDFSWFRPKPEAGTVELWLSGKGEIPSEAAAPAPVDDILPPLPSEFVDIRRRGLLERIFSELDGVLPAPSGEPAQ